MLIRLLIQLEDNKFEVIRTIRITYIKRKKKKAKSNIKTQQKKF